MRIDPRQSLAFALWALAGASMAAATLDYLGYTFAVLDLFEYERRVHGSWWHVSRWLPHIDRTLPGRALMVCAGLGVVAAAGAFALARIRRTARVLLTLAGVCAASGVVITGATAWAFRRRVLERLVDVEPGTAIGWLERGELSGFGRWDANTVEGTGAWLSTVVIVATALAWVRVATRRGGPLARASLAAAAVALPMSIATVVLAVLWRDYGGFERPDHEQYVALVQTGRLAIGAAALTVAVAALPLRGRPARLVPAAGVFVLGVAAFVATTPHRRTIDTLYPLYDSGAAPVKFARLPAPWSFDARVAGTCADVSRVDHHTALVRLDEGGTAALTLNGVEVSLAGDAVVAALRDHADRPDLYRARFLLLLVERRVPVAAVAPLLERLAETAIGAVIVGGIAVQELPSAEGPIVGWHVCAIGDLQLAALRRVRLAPAATWGELVDEPALVRPPEGR